MARKARAQDVADLAGVSRSTVSLVLNGRASGNVSQEKQQAVITAAEQLNYTPNAVALSLRSQRTRTIGVLSWRGGVGFPQVLLHRALQKSHEYRYLLLAMDTSGDAEMERRQIDILLDRQVDGFLIVAPDLVEYRAADALVSTPSVLLNCVDRDGAVTSVAPDEREAGRRAVEVLLSRGHRDIAVVTGDPDSLETRLRVLGIQEALAAAGLTAPPPLPAGVALDGGFRAAQALLTGDARPTALVCTRERVAVGAALAAAELGLSVPADLSLVSFEDGEELAATTVPALTTVHRPDAGMAEQAVTLLVERMSGAGSAEVKQVLFSCPVHDRESVAAPAPR